MAKPKVMIVGDMVSFYEDSVKSIREGTGYRYLTEALANAGGNIEEYYYLKAIGKYYPKKPKKAEIKEWRTHLEEEIEAVSPDYILCLGALSLETLINKTNLSSHRGSFFDYKGIKAMVTYSPGAVIRQPSNLWTFRADLNYFVRSTQTEDKVPKDFEWTLLETYDEALKAINFLKQDKVKVLSYDIETTSLHDTTKPMLMLGVCCQVGDKYRSIIFPMEDTVMSVNALLYREKLDAILSGKGRVIVAQNAKFDNRWLRSRQISPHVTFDTYLAAYTLNSALPHGLKYMAKAYCGATDYDADIEFKEDLTLEEYKAMAKYCALDCYYTLKLYHFLKKELKNDPPLERVFKYIIMPGERVLQKIEDRGVYVNQERLEEVTTEFTDMLEAEKATLDAMLPEGFEDFNPNSPKQLAELLFDKLKLPVISETPTGARSTGRSVLMKLVDKSPIIEYILNIRKYEKALNGFLTPWKDYLEKSDGRLHTTYNIAKTATGRLSAENPNLQQVPRMKEVRNLIGSPEGRVLIQADFSQIELRVAAFIANADSMKRVYKHNGDIHTLTASNVSRVPTSEVTKDMRTKAKAVNFGFLYGMWWKAFKEYAFDSYGVIVTDTEAKQARETYFSTYPELTYWHKRQKEFAIRHTYVRNPLGRIRYLYDIDSHDKDLRGRAERQAINTPVQAMASDMTMLAMIVIDQELNKKYDNAFLVGQVHDAIMVECNTEEAKEVGLLVKKIMESVPILLKKYFGVEFDIPVVADVEVGNWGAGVPLEKI